MRTIVEDAEDLSAILTDCDFAAFMADKRSVLAVERLLPRITEAVAVNDVPPLGKAAARALARQ